MDIMQMVDFKRYEQNQRMYGGIAGRKMGIVYEGKNYILKFPGNLKEQQMKNVWRQSLFQREGVSLNRLYIVRYRNLGLGILAVGLLPLVKRRQQ